MDNLSQKFQEFFNYISTQWKELPLLQKSIIGVLALAVVGSLAFLVVKQEQDKYAYLYQNLEQGDLDEIGSALKKLQYTSYSIDSKGVKVKANDVMRLRLKLAGEGLPSRGQIGWEQFDKQDFTRTKFEQGIDKLRAIQGEMSRTINSLEGIISSRVHIVMPNTKLFEEDEKEPTAAIYLKTYRNVQISRKQIRAITLLVSRSVEGLRPEKVTIVDHMGRMLTEVQSDDPATRMTKEMLSFRKTLESDLRAKVTSLVGRIVGIDKIDAKIDVEVDFTREEKTVSDINPDKVVVLSSNTTNAEMNGRGLNPTGVPGAKSNVPGEQEELVINSNKSESTRNTERLNYEIAKTKSHKVMPVGQIIRITAAVIVDGKQLHLPNGTKPEFVARTPEEMKKIEELVKRAIGYRKGRDEVTVHNIMFELAPEQVEELNEKKEEDRKYITTIAISAAASLALILFFTFIIRPYFRWLSYDPEKKRRQTVIEEYTPDLEMGGIKNIQVKEDIPFEKMTPQEQIRYLAKHDPARTTEGIRMLLNPHHQTT